MCNSTSFHWLDALHHFQEHLFRQLLLTLDTKLFFRVDFICSPVAKQYKNELKENNESYTLVTFFIDFFISKPVNYAEACDSSVWALRLPELFCKAD